MSKKSKVLLTIHLDGKELLMHRSGKANRHDDDVKRGVGVQTLAKYRKKSKQDQKNRLREEY